MSQPAYSWTVAARQSGTQFHGIWSGDQRGHVSIFEGDYCLVGLSITVQNVIHRAVTAVKNHGNSIYRFVHQHLSVSF